MQPNQDPTTNPPQDTTKADQPDNDSLEAVLKNEEQTVRPFTGAPELADTDTTSPVTPAPQVISPSELTADSQPAASTQEAPVVNESTASVAAVEPSSQQPVESSSLNQPSAAAPLAGGTKKKKLALIGGIVAALIVLLGGSALAYFTVILPNQPQMIMQQALLNTFDNDKLSSSGFEGSLDVSGKNANGLSGVDFEGSADKSNKLDAKLTVRTAVTNITTDVKSTDGKSFYVRLSGLEGVGALLGGLGGSSPEMAYLAPLLSSINNQWYSVDESLIKQFAGENAIPKQLSDADLQKLTDAYKKHQFINIDKRLSDEDIHGVASYHVQTSIDKDKLKSFFSEIKDANIAGLKIEQKDIDELDEVNFENMPVDFWVSKKDKIINQVKLSTSEDDTTFDMRFALKDINKEVKVDAPENAKSVLELINSAMPLMMSGGLGGSGSSPSTSQPSGSAVQMLDSLNL